MSFMRRKAAIVAAGALFAFQAIGVIGATSASAATTCTYNPATDTINITLDPGAGVYLAVESADDLDAESPVGAILFTPSGGYPPDFEGGANSQQCGSATNDNTVAIIVLGSPSGAEFLGIDEQLAAAAEVPGTFNPSIAWSVDLGGGVDEFELDLADDTDNAVVLTDSTFSLNGGGGELNGVEDMQVFGGTGDDSVDASALVDVSTLAIWGGTGDDWVAPGAFDGDSVTGGAGTDTLSYGTRTTCTIIDNAAGVAGQDANCDGDLLDTGDENDLISGFEILESGSGNDMLVGAAAVTETFIPGDGDDDITGNAGDGDVLDWSSSSAAMTIDPANGEAVGQGTDTYADVVDYVGSDFDDVLLEDGSTNSFSGGAGVDTVDASADTGGVTIDLDALDPANDDLENAVGGSGSDVLLGNDLRNVLWGNDGDDVLRGFAGNDTFFGGLGNDTFDGGSGADTVDFKASPAGIDADMSLGFASGEGDDSIAGIEIVKGSTFNDQITGGKTGLGSGVNFRITGRAGNDILTGSDSNDYLKGGAGNDKLRGLEGGDTLIGGKGKKDRGWGGPGTDVCKGVEFEKSCEI